MPQRDLYIVIAASLNALTHLLRFELQLLHYFSNLRVNRSGVLFEFFRILDENLKAVFFGIFLKFIGLGSGDKLFTQPFYSLVAGASFNRDTPVHGQVAINIKLAKYGYIG